MERKLIVFDLDGTLSDTKGIIREIIFDTLCGLGIEIDSVQTVWDSIDRNGGEVFGNRAFAPKEYLPLIDRDAYDTLYWQNYDRHYMEACDLLYDGIPETLSLLRSCGHALAVLSNKNDRHVQPIIDKSFPGVFDLVLGAIEGVPRKPDPAGLLLICDRLGFSPRDTYMIGDLPFDCKAALGADANYIAALWGYSTREVLTSKGATLFAEKPINIMDIVK